MPKFKLLYFKTLLDIAFINFFEEHNQYFQNINGQYVLSKSLTTRKIFSLFKSYINNILNKTVEQHDRLNPMYYIIIGSCIPKNNILLKYKNTDRYFPKKLDKIINADFVIKYLLKEKDIKLDLIKFNTVCIDLFNYYFKQQLKNIIFVQHKELDCYATYKLIQYFYGKCNCVNIYKEKFSEIKSPIIAVNDLINTYLNKMEMNKSVEFKNIGVELKQFIDEKIKSI